MNNVLINKKTLIVEQVLTWIDGRKIDEKDYPNYIVKHSNDEFILSKYIYKYDKGNDLFIKSDVNVNLKKCDSNVEELWTIIEELGSQISELQDKIK